MGTHNLGTQIIGLYKSVSVTKIKLFVSYENWEGGRHMFSSQICLCYYLTLVNNGISIESMQKIGQR